MTPHHLQHHRKLQHHHGYRPAMRLSARHERSLYAVSVLLLVSALGWLVSHYFLVAPGSDTAAGFGGLPHPSEPWWMRLHGAAVIVFFVTFGALLPGHVVHGWRRRQNHRSGIFMLAIVASLALTGYGLYYSGDEQLRAWISLTHWIIGLASAVGLTVHVVLGKRSTKRVHVRPQLRQVS